MDLLLLTLLTGVGATLLMDAWSVVRRQWLGVLSLDYAMVGRWIGHMPEGRFIHHPIAASSPVPGERLLGWLAHYLTGIAFAGALPAVAGSAWFAHPTPMPALAVGIGSVIAPFFIMQPALGTGIAARQSPRPAFARMHSLITHAIFGLGLYATAWLLHTMRIRWPC